MTMFMLFSPLDSGNNGALLGDPFGLTKQGQNEAPFVSFSFCFTRNQPYVRCLVDMLHTAYSVFCRVGLFSEPNCHSINRKDQLELAPVPRGNLSQHSSVRGVRTSVGENSEKKQHQARTCGYAVLSPLSCSFPSGLGPLES